MSIGLTAVQLSAAVVAEASDINLVLRGSSFSKGVRGDRDSLLSFAAISAGRFTYSSVSLDFLTASLLFQLLLISFFSFLDDYQYLGLIIDKFADLYAFVENLKNKTNLYIDSISFTISIKIHNRVKTCNTVIDILGVFMYVLVILYVDWIRISPLLFLR